MLKIIRNLTIIAASFLLSAAAYAEDQSASWAAEFPVGSTMPAFKLADQSKQAWHNVKLSGENGYLILFNRSVVW